MSQRSQIPVLDADDVVSIQRHAWWAVMEMHRKLALRLMAEELRNETGIDMATYDVLMHVVKAGDRGIRMTDLAQNVFMSKPGLTAVADRLEQRGLLRRMSDPEDRRAIRLTLTDRGLEIAQKASQVHLSGIENHFADHVTDTEARVILDVMRRVTPES